MGFPHLATNAHMYQVTPTASTSQSAAKVKCKFPILEEDFCRQVMIQMAAAVLKGELSKDASASFLEASQHNLQFLGHLWSSPDKIINTTAMFAQIPRTKEAVFHFLGLLPNLTT